MNYEILKSIFQYYQPKYVVHLAARTTMEGKNPDNFLDNTVGTQNVLEAIKITPSVSRVIITSTQNVRKPGNTKLQSDNSYNPLGLYGERKALTEEITRNAGLNCTWTIIRPTNIWGPGNSTLNNGLWKIMREGKYFHPKGIPVIRSYGYVGNVIWQIEKILTAPENIINAKTFYVGEPPINQLDWVNAFSKALTGKQVRIVPARFIYLLALIGDFLSRLNIHFPMTTSCYRNLTTSNPVPTQYTIDTFGLPPFSLQEGINNTVQWLNHQ